MATRFFNPTDATRVAGSPRIGVGPGFDSQGSVNFFNKYCFPNLHWIHVKALEVEDCEVVPVSVHHHNVLILQEFYSCRLDFERRCPARDNCGYSTTRFPQSTTLFFACPYQPWVDFRSFANFKLYFRCLFDRHLRLWRPLKRREGFQVANASDVTAPPSTDASFAKGCDSLEFDGT